MDKEEVLRQLQEEIARHEMNHYTDYLISRNPNTTTNNNMLKN